jgi:PAS domain S-box-containing protein
MLGMTVAEMIGMPSLSLSAPVDHDQVGECLAEADRVGQARCEALMQRQDGSTFPVRASVVTVRDAAGTLLYRVATIRDIADQRYLQEQLKGNGDLLQAVVAGTSDAVYVKDRDGRYLMYNEAAERISGKCAEDVLGRDDNSLFPPPTTPGQSWTKTVRS